MVDVLMGEKDLGHLFGLVSQRGESLHVGADVLSCENHGLLVGNLLRSASRDPGVDQDDLVAGIDEIIRQTRPVTDAGIEFFKTLFTAERESLGRESVLSELDRLDYHAAPTMQEQKNMSEGR